MLVICYQENGVRSYTMTNLDVNDFQKEHPELTIEMVFDKDDEKFTKDTMQSMSFRTYMGRYGFEESDMNAEFQDAKGTATYRFVGFIPHARKYNCRCENIRTGASYKMTPGYVKTRLEESRQMA